MHLPSGYNDPKTPCHLASLSFESFVCRHLQRMSDDLFVVHCFDDELGFMTCQSIRIFCAKNGFTPTIWTPYHTCPKNLNKFILLPVDVSKISSRSGLPHFEASDLGLHCLLSPV